MISFQAIFNCKSNKTLSFKHSGSLVKYKSLPISILQVHHCFIIFFISVYLSEDENLCQWTSNCLIIESSICFGSLSTNPFGLHSIFILPSTHQNFAICQTTYGFNQVSLPDWTQENDIPQSSGICHISYDFKFQYLL